MKANENNAEYGPRYWSALALQTRRFGHVYVHSGARNMDTFAFQCHSCAGIHFSWRGYGRSLNSGGHKYKVHANYAGTCKPVPSRILNNLLWGTISAS